MLNLALHLAQRSHTHSSSYSKVKRAWRLSGGTYTPYLRCLTVEESRWQVMFRFITLF